MTHTIRRHESLTEGQRYYRVTLLAVPGVELSHERPETEPRQPVIRSKAARRSPAGAALVADAQRRVEWVRQALRDVAEGEA